ncbi:hypothetical protein [Hydrogenophaga sp.]|uniref:hypothetical protein n=1 Tax=Hydrogenophaga sp. TaxID=1904254 RepID=UPI0027216D1B|nr:hypothetical protein [Hydrogenophaga sp.]MDO9439042.1 hypothetical protein [Hydrogenophaga sp.]
MNTTHAFSTLCLALAAVLAGCQDRPAPVAPPPAASAPEAPKASPVADRWVGTWNGPEGTFLKVAGAGGAYDITVQNLDGPRTFKGTAAGDHIEFERDGTKETLRATGGVETGMKWLSEKKDCLTVRSGEGYCRD